MSLPEIFQLFQRCVQPLEVSYSNTKIKTPCGPRPDFFDYNISQAYWESFVELNLLGNAIVLLEEEKKSELIK